MSVPFEEARGAVLIAAGVLAVLIVSFVWFEAKAWRGHRW